MSRKCRSQMITQDGYFLSKLDKAYKFVRFRAILMAIDEKIQI